MREITVTKKQIRPVKYNGMGSIIVDNHPKDTNYYVGECIRVNEKNITNDNLTGFILACKIKFYSEITNGKNKGKIKLHLKIISVLSSKSKWHNKKVRLKI